MGRPQRESNSITKTLADRLSDLMENEKLKTGLKQEEICKKIGVASGSYSEWASDSKTPTVDKVALVANYFETSVDWLLGLSDVKTIDANMKQVCTYTGLTESIVDWLHTFKDDPEYFPFVVNLISEIILTDTLRECVAAMLKASASLAKGISAIESSEEDGKLKLATTKDVIDDALFSHNDYLMRITANDAMKFYKDVAIKTIQEAVKASVVDYCQDKTQSFLQLRSLAAEGKILQIDTIDI